MQTANPARTTGTLVLAALPALLGGCAGEDRQGDLFRAALPPEEGLTIAVPGSQGPMGAGDRDDGTTRQVQALLGEKAHFYGVARETSGQLNKMVADVLTAIWGLAQNPPTVADADHA